MFYLNTSEQLFLFVKQLDQSEVCLPYSRLLTEIPMLVVFQKSGIQIKHLYHEFFSFCMALHFAHICLDLQSGIQNNLSCFPNVSMSSRLSGILRSAVSGRNNPGIAPRKHKNAIIRNGALSDRTD